jgi:hypothetical protein
VFRHRFDPSSVVAAVVFLNIAGGYLNEGFGGAPVSFVWAVRGVLGGILLIVVFRALFRSRRRGPGTGERTGR